MFMFRENGDILAAPNLITNDHFKGSESIKTKFSRKITLFKNCYKTKPISVSLNYIKLISVKLL